MLNVIAFIFSLYLPIATAREWLPSSDPQRIVQTWNPMRFENKIQKLPTAGSIASDQTPWPSSYFPSQRNGFNYRASFFQANGTAVDSQDFSPYFHLAVPNSAADFQKMSAGEIDALSAFEKYSIYTGDYTYQLNHFFHHNEPFDPYWTGACDAWTIAASQNPEPVAKTVRVENTALTFHSSDLKALLTANAELGLTEKTDGEANLIQIGDRCDVPIAVPTLRKVNGQEIFSQTSTTRGLLEKDLKAYLEKYQSDYARLHSNPLPDGWLAQRLKNARSKKCSDTNAGAFHLVLTNQIGLNQRPLLMDIARDEEIWNQPTYRYTSIITPLAAIPENSASETKRAVSVKTTVWYADDTMYGWAFSEPVVAMLLGKAPLTETFQREYAQYENLLVKNAERDSPGKFPEDLFESIDYEYTLELNDQDQIIGGEWITYDRPDYLWIAKKQTIDPVFQRLPELLQQ
jgi:hypothetical protein